MSGPLAIFILAVAWASPGFLLTGLVAIRSAGPAGGTSEWTLRTLYFALLLQLAAAPGVEALAAAA